MIVEIENIGKIEFPDGTDQSVIDRTVKKLVKETPPQEPSLARKLFPSILRTKDIYFEEEAAGRKAMNLALEEPTGMNAIKGFLGALQFGFSPLTAVTRGLVGEPTELTLEQAGVPEPAAEFAGQMTETAALFVPYGKLVQQAIVGKKVLQTNKAAQNLVKELTKKPLEFPEALTEDVIKAAQTPINKSSRKILRTTVLDDVVKELKPVVEKGWKPSGAKRITQELIDYITDHPEEIVKVAEKYKLGPQELAAQMKETMTLAGRDLGRMGRLAREIRQSFNTSYMKQLSEYIESEVASAPVLDKVGTAFKTIENVRRSALVAQAATTMRNIVSQSGRLTLGMMDDAFQGAAKQYLKSGGEGTFQSVKSTFAGMGEGLDLFVATVNRMRPAQRAKLLKLLNSSNALEAKALMFKTPVQDVVLTNKISKTLNTLNTAQEFFFRNIAFEARLKQLARNAGINISRLKAADIPESMFMEAANYSLDMTYAAMPKSKFGKDFVRAMSNPVITALVNPFPRFLYGNALPFLKRFSPLGFLEAARPTVVADIVSGHPEKFAKAISEATLGTIMLNTAAWLRNSEHAGENWYEIKVGKNTIDTRAYAPFSTYLFLAESMQNPERIKPADWGMALLSLNRVGGTGLVLADVLRGKTLATTKDAAKRVAGAYMSGFTVPARTFKDLYSAIDPEEAIYRDVRDSELFGPLLQNIPEASQMFPKARSPLRVGDIRAEHPILRQFTGISAKTKNLLETEVSKIQLGFERIYPGTGSPQGDRTVSEFMAPVLEKAFPILKYRTNYDQLDNTTKRIIMGELFKDAKKAARDSLLRTNPDLALKIKIDRLSDDIEQLLQRRGILPKKIQ